MDEAMGYPYEEGGQAVMERGGQSAMQASVTTIARQPSAEQVLVSACGRTCSVEMQNARSVVDLQASLQRTLQMEGQAFHICDINGSLLSTDMQVQDAIAQGLTPLCATLPDKSLHHLENRREELAQMQWKLVRDQMTQGNNQVTQLTRQMSELQYQVQALQRESQQALDQCRQEFAKAVDMERSSFKADIQSVQEGVNGAVLLINGERSKRELSVQGFEKHIHGVCDMLDGERASRRQDLAMHMSVMQELRTSQDAEKSSRTDLQAMVMDLERKFTSLAETVNASSRDQAENLMRVQNEASVSLSEILGRFGEIEDRSAAIENSLAETTSWATGSLDKLGERHERLSQATETMRLSSQRLEGSIANCLERINEQENLVRQYDGETRDLLARERQIRDDQVRRSSQTFSSEYLKQITEVEKRLTSRLERESAEREKNFQGMIDEVAKIVEDRKLFRDQTITKTVNLVTNASQGTLGPNASQPSSPRAGRSGTWAAGDSTWASAQGSYQPVASEMVASVPLQVVGSVHEKAQPINSGPSITSPDRIFSPGAQSNPVAPVRSVSPMKGGTLTQATVQALSGSSLPFTGGSQTLPIGTSIPINAAVGMRPASNPGSVRAPLGAAPLSARVLSGPARVSPAVSSPRGIIM